MAVNQGSTEFEGIQDFKKSRVVLSLLEIDTSKIYSNEEKAAMPIGTNFWDAPNRCITTKVSADVYIQNNQEQNQHLINITENDIPNGKYVRIVGYDINTKMYAIELSDNSTRATAFVDFMTTELIPANGGTGLGVKSGIVHDLNTTGGISGNPTYLGTQGNHTSTKPVYPAIVVVVGMYGKIAPVDGDVFVDINKSYQFIINDIQDELGLRANQNVGICQKCPIFANDIVIDYNTPKLTIATIRGGQAISVSNPIVFFTNGNGEIYKHVKNTPQQVNFNNTTGKWYFYFDSNGDLVASQIEWTDFHIIAPLFILNWDATQTDSVRAVEEQIEMHTNSISADDHANQHFGTGTIHLWGFDLVANKLTAGSPNVDGRNTCLSLTTGSAMDDNLRYTVTNTPTPTTYFQQDMGQVVAGSLTLSNAGLFPIRYNSAGGQLSYLPATRFPFAWDVATNRPQYITATGVRTLVTDNRYFVYYIYVLQDRKVGQSVRIVSAETDFTTITNAQAHSWETLQTLYEDLRSPECRQLYKCIFLADNSGGGAFNAVVKFTRFHESVDIRKQKTVTATSTTGSVLESNVITPVRVVLSGTNQASNNAIIESIFGGGITDEVLTSSGNGTIPIWKKASGGANQDSIEFPLPTTYTYTGDYVTKVVETINGGTIEKRLRYYISASPIVDGSPDIMEYKNSFTEFWGRATYVYTAGKLTSITTETITDWSI